ncbi:MAG: type II toxin-antitoxin system VapC family toxin [Mariprofundus sp.]|nr:type II toxin-antitoxin system VapC family toxin [Mariprofundus sp.]
MIVADTNLIAYLLIPGEKTACAQQVYMHDSDWQVPQLWRSELRNVLMLYVRKQHLPLAKAIQIMVLAEKRFGAGQAVASQHVLTLTAESDCSAYDCEFVALAEKKQVSLITSDKKVQAAFPSIAISPESFVVSFD